MRLHLGLISGILWGMAASVSLAAPQIGQPAPDFTAQDTNGNTITLSELAGQLVILEWTNHQCPFVGKHYSSGNMQALQKESTADGLVWLSMISSAPGEQGYVTAAEANELTESREAAPTAVILDPEGEIGQLYAARTTPHLYVIDEEGRLQYMGAIDSIPSAQISDLESAENYVRTALQELQAEEAVSTPATQPYGCSVKYKS
ncbi:MAG: redoxin domain-containing protein [Synechococcaceae cyanobacterium SM2_3_1]|nr:redoxin domain-containing protein [Synechococcaceae cyanobacterium SM2_3_1]